MEVQSITRLNSYSGGKSEYKTNWKILVVMYINNYDQYILTLLTKYSELYQSYKLTYFEEIYLKGPSG